MTSENFPLHDNPFAYPPMGFQEPPEESEMLKNPNVLADRIFGDKLPTPAELEAAYPPRNLPENAMVTRVGPSPTGYMHVGTLYIALLSERFAHQSDGVFILRIEDTDKKREVEGATEFISASLQHFDIAVDEGRDVHNAEHGLYGPYTQSERMSIYHTYIKDLLERGLAYPCFSNVDDLTRMREQQAQEKVPPGYYGKWATWRDKPVDQVLAMLDAGHPYVIRFRSNGDIQKRVDVNDQILGNKAFPENNQDIVIMKSDGLPTYHLAHVVDDHLMRTTNVIRASEWVSSIPLHLQLFEAFGWTPPKYAHIMPIQKIEGNSKRKLSKRKDPEASVGYFEEVGYPPEAVTEYLLNIANSNFEDWRKANPDTPSHEFKLDFHRLSQSTGPVFDFKKLDDISKDVLSRLSGDQLFDTTYTWAKKYDVAFAEKIATNEEYVKKILSIERGGPNARKDYSKLSALSQDIEFYFDEQFKLDPQQFLDQISPITLQDAGLVTDELIKSYFSHQSKEEWFDNIKRIARENNFAEKMGEYKKNPESYKGNLAEMVKIYRLLLTGRVHTPDLHAIMQVMGSERISSRLSAIDTMIRK